MLQCYSNNSIFCIYRLLLCLKFFNIFFYSISNAELYLVTHFTRFIEDIVHVKKASLLILRRDIFVNA